MSALLAAAYAVGYVLLVITAVTSARDAWRHRDRHRLDILIAVGSLVALPLLRRPAGGPILTALGLGVFLAQPYFLFRLVRHFRDVPAALRILTLVVPILATAAALVWPVGFPPAEPSALRFGYLAALLGYVAVAFGKEATRKSGVTAKRLVFAALGAGLFALTALFALVVVVAAPGLSRFIGQLNPILHAAVLTCFFFAFNTPRRLRSNWQRGEQAKYLSRVADRDPEERGRRAADDLSFAGASAVGNAVTIVALGDTPDADQFTVRSSSNPAFNGLMIRPGDGIIGRVCRTRAPVADAVAACERDIAGKARQYGVRVLAAPIVADTNFWGVVLVVQRRGSLFPDDDLELLAQLARYAAAGLDHAHLIAEIRARERRAADRRLREIETRMSLMLDSIKDYAMFVMDEHGRIVTWHIGAEHVFGHSSREIADAAAAPLFAMTDADFAALLSEARRVGHADREGPCRRRDGTRFVGATTVRPLADDDERLGGFVAVTRDVTEQRNLEDRLRQSQKMEAVGQLAGGIAHDFNNLLTAVLGYADMLAQDFADDPEHAAQIHEIQRAGEVAAGLTRQLLAFSRRQVVQPVVTDLTALVEDLVPMLRRVLGQKIEIDAAAAPNLAPILADRHQMEQILLNLSVNARDAMPRGGRLTIRTANVSSDESAFVSDDLPGPSVLLEVADTGIGMDPTVLPRIFEPFYTTKALGRGTGLGLATVYGIVQQMGGVIRVTSQPNQGATFKLYFPHVQLRDAERGARASASGTEGSETVLLVEDQPAVRTFVTQTLERHGYRVLAAEDQSDALAVVQSTREPIDLVITDVLMPGGTGPELVRALDQIRPGLPALFMSGYADAIVSDRESRSTTRDFLQKPFSAADLLSRIRDILGRR